MSCILNEISAFLTRTNSYQIMTEFVLPEDLLNTLKCYLCGKYLSVGPVISISDDGKPYKCGRCQDIPSEKNIRNLCYENVAAFLTFPCSYKNCEVKLKWNQVEKHEKHCRQRIIQCVVNRCDTLVEVEDFEKHFKSHSVNKAFLNSINNFEVKKYCNSTFFLRILTDQFIVVIRYYSGTVYVGVFSLQPLLNTTFFDLKIMSVSLYSPTVSYKAEVIEYDEPIHCINCMRRKCNLRYHKFSENYCKGGLNKDALPLRINFQVLEELLLFPAKLIYSVSIFSQATNLKNPISNNSLESGITEMNLDSISDDESETTEQ